MTKELIIEDITYEYANKLRNGLPIYFGEKEDMENIKDLIRPFIEQAYEIGIEDAFDCLSSNYTDTFEWKF